ncbi:interferon-induced protein with tetratricopeptide repeats 2 isoform 1-T1 [Molossus nigricans]
MCVGQRRKTAEQHSSLDGSLPEEPSRQSTMSRTAENSLESCLRLLSCHFTWNLLEGERSLDDIEDTVCHQGEQQKSEFKATKSNLLAYINHHRGRSQEALACLQQAEESVQQEHGDQAEIRSLVTWGNYAWVYYHLGRLSEAQAYVDKVRRVCEKFSSPYRMESPELDCEEGWSQLQCGGKHVERAKVCFEKCLEKNPKNPEFVSGLAIASYHLDERPVPPNPKEALRQAIRLNPDDQYLKVLLALKLQKMKEEGEGERLVAEAVERAPYATDVLRGAAMLYRRKHDWDRAIRLLKRAVKRLPHNAYLHYSIGMCYRAKVLQGQKGVSDGTCGEGEDLWQLRGHAVDHLKKADELNGNLPHVCSYLACFYAQAHQYEEAEYYFQKEFSKELTPVDQQVLHLRYGNFQWYDMKCASKAIQHFIEGVKINRDPQVTEKMKNKLQRIAQTRLSRRREDPETLHLLAFLQKLNGGKLPVDENSERGLASGRLSPSASLEEE